MIAWLCIGSNQLKPRAQVQKAVRILSADPKIHVTRKSSLVRSEAYGNEDQPDFRNQVIEVETKYSPLDLMYEDEVMQTMSLTLPHPDFHRRRFVLELLCEIDPGLRHPVLNKTMSQLLSELEPAEEQA